MRDLQWISVLSKTVQAWVLGQACPESHILTFEDDWGTSGVEENLAIRAPRDREAERVLDVRKKDLGAQAATVGGVVRAGDYRLGYLVDGGRGVLD